MNRQKWMVVAASASLIFLFGGCNRGDEDPDTAVDDIEVPDTIELSGDTSIGFDSTDPVIDVDPEEYRNYLAQATSVDADPILLEAKKYTAAYKNGRPKREFSARTFKNRPPLFIGEFKEWYENGQVWKQGMYADGKRNGPWKYWSPKGIIVKSGSYQNGYPDGEWTFFRQDGTRQRVESYAVGKKDGTWIENDASGRVPIMKVSFKDSRRHGTSIQWFPRTAESVGNELQKLREVEYVDGRQHGKATEWHENGQTKTTIEFRNGKRHGRAAQWDSQGNLLAEFQFRDGERVD